MKDELFQELVESVTEMGAVMRGERGPRRTFEVDDDSLDIAAIRARFNLSRPKFAAMLGISPRTLEGWEQGRREPEGPAKVLMRVAARYPESVLDAVAGKGRKAEVSSGRAVITRAGKGAMSGNRRSVFKRDDGTWANKRDDASRAGSIHRTQAEAEKAAREMLRNSGGGELTTHGRDGRIRSKDTIAPGNDPNPPKDKEH